ncbi:MAG: DNA mismatch repair endonuclease MutL [Victivallales bacterium]|nr:DNA mismatch repair endonuclease MutL [Victivallales bacterium]
MSIIRVLSAEVAGRIAAGEVVERPASVVKELVENSIDAGATRIRIAAEQGGQRLIQVTDNGCGMDRDDAIMCFEAHATSKISTEADVGQIKSLGFRGEAIPSISSVSRFILQTRRKEDDVGTEIVVDNGAIRDVQDCGCAPGTNIKVAHLFGNLPARRKFLKGPDTEDGHIEEMVLQLALARPDISFSLVLNNREVIRASATSDLGARILMLLGKDVYEAMLPVNYQEDGISVRGFISKPGFTRVSRRDQRTIVNGRTATADTVFFAIRDAYDTLVVKGRYPSTVLYIDLPPDRVDVNVHPTKREVRFRDPRQVGGVIAAAIRASLRQLQGGEDPSMQPSPIQLPPVESVNDFPPLPEVKPQPVENKPSAPSKKIAPPSSVAPAPAVVATPYPLPAPQPFKPEPQQISLPLPDRPTSVNPPASPPKPADTPAPQPSRPVNSDLASLRICGRLGNRHLLAESANGLVIIDLRAAHQRILFEKLLANLKEQKIPQQPLLIPVTINFGQEEARFLNSQIKHFQSLGFTIEHFGGTSFIVTAVPASYPNQDISQTLRDIIDDLRQSRTTNVQSAIHIAQAACRHAISLKANLTEKEVNQLIFDLARATMPYADPNGNPTMIHITYSELEKRFKG